MNRLPPPATGVEIYLAAIHDRLGEILGRLDGGQVQEPPTGAAVPVDGMSKAERVRAALRERESVTPAPTPPPTKRTRQRSPRQS